MRFGLILGLLAWLTAGAHAATLAFQDPANATRCYLTDIAVTGQVWSQGDKTKEKVTGRILFTSREKVIAVDKAGIALIEAEILDGSAILAAGEEKAEQALTGYKVTFRRAPNGVIDQMLIAGVPANGGNTLVMGMMSALTGGRDAGASSPNPWKMLALLGLEPTLPAGEVKDGASWASTQNAQALLPPETDYTLKSVLKGEQTVDGTACRQIASAVKMRMPETEGRLLLPGDGGPSVPMTQTASLSGTTTLLFDPAAGAVVSAALDVKLDISMTLRFSAEKGDTLTASGALRFAGSQRRVPEPPPAAPTPAEAR